MHSIATEYTWSLSIGLQSVRRQILEAQWCKYVGSMYFKDWYFASSSSSSRMYISDRQIYFKYICIYIGQRLVPSCLVIYRRHFYSFFSIQNLIPSFLKLHPVLVLVLEKLTLYQVSKTREIDVYQDFFTIMLLILWSDGNGHLLTQFIFVIMLQAEAKAASWAELGLYKIIHCC